MYCQRDNILFLAEQPNSQFLAGLSATGLGHMDTSPPFTVYCLNLTSVKLNDTYTCNIVVSAMPLIDFFVSLSVCPRGGGVLCQDFFF